MLIKLLLTITKPKVMADKVELVLFEATIVVDFVVVVFAFFVVVFNIVVAMLWPCLLLLITLYLVVVHTCSIETLDGYSLV